MIIRESARVAAFAAVALMLSAPADAQIFRAYVSSTGSDSNPCSLPAPCRLLPAALTAVADGGEIWMLDSANYNTSTVTVTKSVTIRAIPGVMGSIVSTAGNDAMIVNAPGIVVNLRNLAVVQLGNSNKGIEFYQGAALNIEGCEFDNIVEHAILAGAPNAFLNVKDTVIRNSGTGIDVGYGTSATIERLQITGSVWGVMVDAGGRAVVRDSMLSGMNTGVMAYAISGAARLEVDSSTIAHAGQAVYSQTLNPGDVAEVIVTRSVLDNSSTAAITVHQPASTTASVTVGDSYITQNAVGFSFLGGLIYSRGNNTLKYNTQDVNGGGLTPMATM